MDAIINQIKLKVKNQDQQIKLINFIISSKNGQKIPKLFVLYGTGNNDNSMMIQQIRDHLGDSCADIHGWHKSGILSLSLLNSIKNKNLIVLSPKEFYFSRNLQAEYVTMLLNNKYYRRKSGDVDEFRNTANYIIESNKLSIVNNLTKDMYEIIEFS